MNKRIAKPTIYAYGFDKCGFSLPSAPLDTSGYTIEFLGYESDSSLEEANGLVIPSGIFEEFYWERDGWGDKRLNVRFDQALLASREKQLFNAFKKGIWTAFLLRAVNNGQYNNWTETDLAKKFLNIFAEHVTNYAPNPYVTCKATEFREYMDRFGIAQTKFSMKDNIETARVIAHESDTPVALEVHGQFFFLPFFTTKIDRSELTAILKLTVESVLEYKRKNDIYLPAWLTKIEFKSESQLKLEIQKTEELLVKLNEEAEKWEKYKAILCTSGSNLGGVVVQILRDFFDLKIKSEEQYVDDAIIYDDRGQVIFVVEIKGVNGGVKREHINQVDSHRERLSLNAKIPGLLVINDFMDVEDFEQRKGKTFDQQNLVHAQNLNVKVLRTVTLFEMMLASEEATDRTEQLLAACNGAAPLVKVT
jgi:hypothetical protein